MALAFLSKEVFNLENNELTDLKKITDILEKKGTISNNPFTFFPAESIELALQTLYEASAEIDPREP